MNLKKIYDGLTYDPKNQKFRYVRDKNIKGLFYKSPNFYECMAKCVSQM